MVDLYLRWLQPDNTPEVRRIAADALRGHAEPRMIGPLHDAMASEDPELRLSAARTLAEAAALLSASAARRVLDDPEIPATRALDLLGRPLGHTVRSLLHALDDPDPLVQSHAAGLLASVPHAAAMATLRTLLGDPGTELLAAGVLATRGDRACAERIVLVLTDAGEPPEHRWIAARSAIHVDDDRARAALCEALGDHALVDAWLASDAADDVPRLLELATASPSPQLREVAAAAQERITKHLPESDDFSGDVRDLVSRDSGRRQAARQVFIEGDAKAQVDDLARLIDAHFDDGTVLTDVVEVLGHLADPASTDTLARLLTHEDWNTRLYAARALGELGDRALEPLCDALEHDSSEYVRVAAVKALGRFNANARAGAALTRTVIADPTLFGDDLEERVVRPAGVALAAIGYGDATPDLVAALEHDHAPVRRSAAWALGELRAVESAAALRTLLSTEEVEYVLRAGAWAVGVMRDPEAVPVLLSILRRARRDATRSEAVFALGEIRDPAAVPSLIATLDSGSVLSTRAARALGQLKATEALSKLVEIVQDSGNPAELRQTAVGAVGQVGDRRATGPLLDALGRETDAATRAALIRAIGELGGVQAVREFETLATTAPDERERRAAVVALGRIGDRRSLQVLRSVAARDSSRQTRTAALRALEALQKKLEPE